MLKHAKERKSATALSRGNIAFRAGKYAEAIAHYEEALQQVPELEKIIAANLLLAKNGNNKADAPVSELNSSQVLASNQQLATVSQTYSGNKIAVVVHYFYSDIWKEIQEKLTALPPIFDLFVTVPLEKAEAAFRDVLAKFPSARIQAGKNIGMDIVPFLSLIPTLANEGYYAVCKLQTKKGDGHLAAIWRQVMLDSLIGSRQNFTRAIDAFLSDKSLCLIGPAALYQSGQQLMYDNAHNLSTILKTSYDAKLPEQDWGFFAGTMFWSRIDVLEKIAKDWNFTNSALDGEYKKDGKAEHALERFFGILPILHNGKVGLLQPKKSKHDECEVLVCAPGESIGHAHIGDVMRQLERIDSDRDFIKKSGYFSDSHYIAQNPELQGIEIDLIYHYLTQGRFRGKQPCGNFSTFDQISSYLKERGDQQIPFLFFIEHGGDNIKIAQHIENNRHKRPTVFNRDLVEKTGLFDKDYYYQQYPEALKTGDDPLEHYFTHGTLSEIYPNRYFIPREYRDMHSDVVNAGIEPFYHYLIAGALEGRRYRTTKWREEDETPFFRYMVLNATLINWPSLVDRETVEGMASIVIPIYGNIELTKNCVISILSATTSMNYEIVCVDNGSEKAMSELLTKFAARNKRVKYIRNKENYNFSLGCNLGFQAAAGEYIVFLNNDTTVTNGWLDELIQPLINKRIVAVQPKLIYPDGKIQNVGVVFAPKQTLGYPIYANSSSVEPCVNISRDYQAITAACMAIRAKDFAKAKGFDPLFINGQEDIDLCLRLTHGTNRVCRYQASSVVVHHESKTPNRGKYIKLNRKSFIERWRNRVEADDFKYYADDKFKIVKWNRDNDEMVKEGLGISRPTLEKVDQKVSRLWYFWDSNKEQEILRTIQKIYSQNLTYFKAKLISIVMPTFNRAEVIEKAIESVLQQSHQNFEIHICDDGSTDNTQNVTAKYLIDARVKFHQLNHSGVSSARNKGLASSRGELVAYLDSDNTWDKDFLKTMLVVVDKGELDAAYCAIHATDDDGKTVCYRGDIFDWSECLNENYIDMNAFVHTRTTARFDENLKRLVDWDFILRVTKQARVAYVPYVGVNYYDGSQILRITQSEYIGDKLAEMQKFIRIKHQGSQPDHFPTDNNIDIASFLLLDQKSKNEAQKPNLLEQINSKIHIPLKFRIKIGCPNLAVSHEWGDYHFANAMKRSLEKLGHTCTVDCLDQWDSVNSLTTDIVIVLRGLSRYKPKEGQINLMWNISHPDKISLEEYAEYDHVFVASITYAEILQKKLAVPVSSLLQCTDPDLFNPKVEKKPRHDVLFVGNSRNVYRNIVRDAIQAGLPLSVYGSRWEKFIPKHHIAGEHIKNNDLAGYYASAGIVLNDHWDSMREYGFISNRLFDAAACSALVVTDNIEGLNIVFGDAFFTYTSPAQLKEIYDTASLLSKTTERLLLSENVIKNHCFDSRIKQITLVADEIMATKKIKYKHDQQSLS